MEQPATSRDFRHLSVTSDKVQGEFGLASFHLLHHKTVIATTSKMTESISSPSFTEMLKNSFGFNTMPQM